MFECLRMNEMNEEKINVLRLEACGVGMYMMTNDLPNSKATSSDQVPSNILLLSVHHDIYSMVLVELLRIQRIFPTLQ